VPFEVILLQHSSLWVKCLQIHNFGGQKMFSSQLHTIYKLVLFYNYQCNSNQILHNDKDHQVLIVGWFKFKMAALCHFDKNKKLQYLSNHLWFWQYVRHIMCFMQGCAFFGLRLYCTQFWGQCSNLNYILHSDKDHLVLFVGGPKMRPTNPRWQMAAVSKKN